MTRGMSLSDAVVAAVGERRSWLCHPLDGRGVLWVLVAHGELWRRMGRRWEPFAASVAQQTSDGWRVSVRGPRTVKARRRS